MYILKYIEYRRAYGRVVQRIEAVVIDILKFNKAG